MRKGQKLSQETKAKMSAAKKGIGKSAETRKNMSVARKLLWQNPEFREKQSARNKATMNNPEIVARQSESLKRAWRKPGARERRANTTKSTWQDPERRTRRIAGMVRAWIEFREVGHPNGKHVAYKNIYFRSTYEARVARALDALGIAWEYEPRRFDLGNESYLPDFLINNSVWAEVKGWLSETAKRKIDKFQSQYRLPFVMLFEDDIKRLESAVRRGETF